MPHLRFRALKFDQVATLSATMIPVLAKTLNSPEENFTLELVQTQFFRRGQLKGTLPFVEVLWFDRPQALQDECARIITHHVNEVAPGEDLVIVFTKLSKESYYENGDHF